VPRPTILDAGLTHSLDQGRPTDNTNEFSPTDAVALVWFEVSEGQGNYRARAEWYTPQGDLYLKKDLGFGSTEPWPSAIAHFSIAIRNEPAAQMLGQWRVRVFLGDALEFYDSTELTFQITSKSGGTLPPPPTRSTAPRIVGFEGDRVFYVGDEFSWIIDYQDPDADIVKVLVRKYRDGQWLDMGSGDPGSRGKTSGRIRINLHCSSPEQTTVAIQLEDAAGNQSEPYNVALECRGSEGTPPPVQNQPPYFVEDLKLSGNPITLSTFFGMSARAVDPEGQPITYLWDYGDGFTTTSEEFAPVLGHYYSAPGNYYVCVTASDPQGASTQQCAWLTVLDDDAGVPPGGGEICGNGIDDDGDGYIDEDCARLEILLDDTGGVKDDIFSLYIDGQYRGPDTPVGGRRFFSIDDLTPGQHLITVYVVEAGVPGNLGSFTLSLLGGPQFSDGTTIAYGCYPSDGRPGAKCDPDSGPLEGEYQEFYIYVPSRSQSASIGGRAFPEMKVALKTQEAVFEVQRYNPQSIELNIFDLAGQIVFSTSTPPGLRRLSWQYLTNEGQQVANGTYFYSMTVIGFNGEIKRSEVKKLAVVR